MALRIQLGIRQSWLCTACEQPLQAYLIDVDHIVPRCEGGSNSISNLQLLCTRCHRHKCGEENKSRAAHHKTLSEYSDEVLAEAFRHALNLQASKDPLDSMQEQECKLMDASVTLHRKRIRGKQPDNETLFDTLESKPKPSPERVGLVPPARVTMCMPHAKRTRTRQLADAENFTRHIANETEEMRAKRVSNSRNAEGTH